MYLQCDYGLWSNQSLRSLSVYAPKRVDFSVRKEDLQSIYLMAAKRSQQRSHVGNWISKDEPTNQPFLLGNDHCFDLFENSTDLRRKTEKKTFS